MRIVLHIMFLLCVFTLSAQIFPIIRSPQTINPNAIFQSPQSYSQPNIYNELSDIQKRNNAMVRQDLANHEQHMKEVQRQSDIKMLINTGFPTLSDLEGTSSYYNAFNEIDSMLNGQIPMNLGRAVFRVENAFYSDSLNYNDYKKAIADKINLCKAKIKEEKMDGSNNMVKNMMLYSLLTDTLKIKQDGNKKTVTSYPLKYNLEDYKSEVNYDSHFVVKLMQTNIGQCHSMPLYYLVLAEEMGAEAFWSFSPRHSFVKIQDDEGVWYNLELTCGTILSDAHYMNNSYIKAEALRNRIYLEPLDKTNTVAELLLELAQGYKTKFGLDDFYLKCVETAAKHTTNDLNVKIFKANYQERLTLTLASLLQAQNPGIMKEKSPEAYKHYELMQEYFKQIDDMGYEELPPNIYGNWLDHVAKLKEQSKKEDKSMFLLRKLE